MAEKCFTVLVSVEFLMDCLKWIDFSVLFNSELNMIWTCCVRNIFNCQWLQGNGFINMDQVSISQIKSEWISEVCTSSFTVSDGGIDCMTGSKRSFRLYPISHHHSTSKIMSQALRCLSFIDWFIDHFQFCSSYIFWTVVVIEMDWLPWLHNVPDPCILCPQWLWCCVMCVQQAAANAAGNLCSNCCFLFVIAAMKRFEVSHL